MNKSDKKISMLYIENVLNQPIMDFKHDCDLERIAKNIVENEYFRNSKILKYTNYESAKTFIFVHLYGHSYTTNEAEKIINEAVNILWGEGNEY